MLSECGQCAVTIVLNGEQSTLEFVSIDVTKVDTKLDFVSLLVSRHLPIVVEIVIISAC